MNLYNENDPGAARWLRGLVRGARLGPGTVSEACITQLPPSLVADAAQVHLFAGIGGWPLALDLAGWPRDCPVWTGSAPCQPFSTAGKKKGRKDDRHLWPAFASLVREHRPSVIFGEQVASKAGRSWFASVQADLETVGYASSAFDLCAASVGAPHIRQRLFWVAISDGERLANIRLRLRQGRQNEASTQDVRGGSDVRPEPRSWWDGCEYLPAADGSSRPAEPGTHPLATGVPQRLVKFRGYGNSLVVPLAVVFVSSVIDHILGVS